MHGLVAERKQDKAEFKTVTIGVLRLRNSSCYIKILKDKSYKHQTGYFSMTVLRQRKTSSSREKPRGIFLKENIRTLTVRREPFSKEMYMFLAFPNRCSVGWLNL